MEAGAVLAFLLQGAMIVSVLALGLKARAADVLYLWHRPGLLLRSFLAMYFVTPLIAVLLVLLLNLPPGQSLGLLLVAVSAGAPLLPKTLLKLGCNPPYVYSLLVSTALAAVLTVPCSLAVLSPILPEHAGESALAVAVVVARTFFVPLAVGMVLRHLAPLTADRIRGPVLLAAGLVLVTVLLGLLGWIHRAGVRPGGSGGSSRQAWSLPGHPSRSARRAFGRPSPPVEKLNGLR